MLETAKAVFSSFLFRFYHVTFKYTLILRTSLEGTMPESFGETERRRYLRVHPAQTNPIRVAVNFQDTVLEAEQVKDVSLGGIAFRLPEKKLTPPIGQNLNSIELVLPAYGKIQTQGVVRRYDRETGTEPPVMAIEFLRLPYSGEKKLFQYINQRQRELRMFSAN